MARRSAARPLPFPDLAAFRTLADQAFSRAAGAPLVGGNHVRVLCDADENYPAWERAIQSATRTIHVEMYIFHRDRIGRRFVEVLTERARAGVKVRLVYDWFGCGLGPILGLFKPLSDAGGEVRAFNPPTFRTILGWARRNHRKLITVDSRVAYVSGLCIGQMWVGDASRGESAWRDTGLEIVGPAVAHAEQAFAESWRLCGGDIDPASLVQAEAIAPAGDVNLRLIATEPFIASVLQLDLLVAALARRTLWITDAYFAGHGPYTEALRRAARDGVDVRLLLPAGSDIGWTVPLARTLYRTLLEAGVRIFEWNGTMLHAKTAVADGRWARIGSTNLNLTSWLGNWELDVAIEDAQVASALAAQYERDLEQSIEIVLRDRGPAVAAPRPTRVRPRHRTRRRMARTMSGVGRSLGAVVTGNRPLEDFEVGPMLGAAALLLALAVLAIWRPALLAWPVAIVAGWTGLAFAVEAFALWKGRRQSP
jgi:phosphatidylserine/phosphatidylglycerophosphate/cardiolipin synthase-like enzyme